MRNTTRKMHVWTCGNRAGFTLLEMLIVIGIIILLAGLLLPLVG